MFFLMKFMALMGVFTFFSADLFLAKSEFLRYHFIHISVAAVRRGRRVMRLFSKVQRVRRKDFMAAVTAASAMVAFADGIVRPEEMAKLIEYIRIDETLGVFDPVEVIGEFERFVDVLGFDFNIGKEKAFSAISKVERRSEEAKLIVLIACAIGAADEDFNNDQRLMVREICTRLGFDPREFDLNLRAPSLNELPKAHPKIHPNIQKIVREDVNMPEWMRHLPAPGTRPVPRKPDEHPKSHPVPEPDAMPEWMRKPPEAPLKKESSSTADTPFRKEDDTVPEWMRNPPEPMPAPKKNADPGIPEWMKKK